MPKGTLLKADTESATPILVGSIHYKEDETYADARRKLDAVHLIDYEYEFLDVTYKCRMPIAMEQLSMVADDAGKIIVIPTNQKVVSGFGISAVSNRAIGTSSGAPIESIEGLVEGPNPQDDIITYSPGSDADSEPDPIVTPTVEDEAQVIFQSQLMPKAFQQTWDCAISKLKSHVLASDCKDLSWKVKTWDDGDKPAGNLLCCECDQTLKIAPKTGIIDKQSIHTVFTNFRKKHCLSVKHVQNVAKRRGIDVAEALRATTTIQSDKAVLEQHIKIVEGVNGSHGTAQSTFAVIGDVNMDPLDLSKFKLRCRYDGLHLVLISKQCNLESRLKSHCDSIDHCNAVSRASRPPLGGPLLTGKPGRPQKIDCRDKKQRSIQGWCFSKSSSSGSSSQSSVSARSPIAEKGEQGSGIVIDPKSMLCWGLWWTSVKYKDDSRPIKGLLYDQLKENGDWWAEPLVREEVWCESSEKMVVIEGLFRHSNCSRVSKRGGGFEGLICEHCFMIPQKPDFRARVRREAEAEEKRGTRGTGMGRRLTYLTIPEISLQSTKYRKIIAKERKLQRCLRHRVLMLSARIPKVRDICAEAINQKEVMKFCTSIVLAHKKGAFGGKSALWDMLRDIASNLTRDKEGHRYRKGTKLLCQTLFLHGGRRVVDCLKVNGIGPSLHVLQRDRKSMVSFRVGLHDEQFKFVAEVYSAIKKEKGIIGLVPCLLAEDETCVKRTVRWQPIQDALLGFCGKTKNHICEVGLELKVGDGKSGFENITNAFENYVIGHQARCIMVNPLVAGFPRLCVLATCTCNRFDSDWVRNQWILLQSKWNTFCLPTVGPLLGHASDGDSRRRKLMLADYTGVGTPGPRQNLQWEGWELSHSLVKVGTEVHAYGLHDQDYIHNGKKLVNPLDSTTRILKLGSRVAQLEHFIPITKHCDISDHGLKAEDISRTDRQNWASAQRLCSRKACHTMKKYRLKGDAGHELTEGTEAYITICADYLDIFMNPRLTLRERIILCGKVGFFFRLWRLWCVHGNHQVGGNTQNISFAKSCISMQTFLDIQMSVHFVVLLIIQFRDNFKHLPVPLHLTGSDICEQFFSKVGGMKGHERSYDISELVDCATNLNRLAAMDMGEELVGVGKSHKKHSNLWMKLQVEDGRNSKVADQTDYTGIESNAEVIEALKMGLRLAQNEAILLEMNPSTSCKEKKWWDTPWMIEKLGVKQGGWCTVNLDSVRESENDLGEEIVYAVESSKDPTEELSTDLIEDLDEEAQVIAEEEVEQVMCEMFSELVDERQQGIETSFMMDIKPTVTYDGQEVYKSTLVSQMVGNPHLSKDRKIRVKYSFYFNNSVDKHNEREGAQTMFMAVSTDCAVYFVDDTKRVRDTRSTVTSALHRKRKNLNSGLNHSGGPRGRAVPVDSSFLEGSKADWWIGRVQSIQKKYGTKIDRCREAIDLLDRPGPEAACRVLFNWFTPVGNSKQKFKYDMVDPQWIDLESVISIVSLSLDPSNQRLYLDANDSRPKSSRIFVLDPGDKEALDTYIKEQATTPIGAERSKRK